ncbi:MAG: MscS family membrane protein, partial [Planctomycetota bacterium]
MKEAIEELCAWLTVRFGEGPGVAAGVLGASLAIGLLLHFVVLRGLAMLLSKTNTDLDERVLAALRGPVIFSVVLLGAYVAVQQLGASPEIAGQLLLTIGLSLWVMLGLRMARLLVQHASHMADRFDAIDMRTAPLFGNVATVLVIGLGLYLLLLIWGVDPTGWLASAGIVGVAVGFAAKDTLSNLFAGVFIIADAPYQIG